MLAYETGKFTDEIVCENIILLHLFFINVFLFFQTKLQFIFLDACPTHYLGIKSFSKVSLLINRNNTTYVIHLPKHLFQRLFCRLLQRKIAYRMTTVILHKEFKFVCGNLKWFISNFKKQLPNGFSVQRSRNPARRPFGTLITFSIPCGSPQLLESGSPVGVGMVTFFPFH